MRSNEEFDEIRDNKYHIRGYDYRYVRPGSQNGSLRESINRRGVYLKPTVLAHPKDCSVMTYRGHAVLKTLIRCYFSPAETTGGQYIYSGSYDGKIHVSMSIVSGVAELLTLEYGDATGLVA
jgi:WD repeat-containing protein 23